MTFGQWLRNLVGWPPIIPPSPAPKPTPPTPSPFDPTGLIAAINAARADRGLKPLARDSPLTATARSWADYMARSDNLTHGDFAGRINSVHANVVAGECIAAGQEAAAEVVAGWLADVPHSNIVLGDFDAVGVGMMRDGSGMAWWVADFARL